MRKPGPTEQDEAVKQHTRAEDLESKLKETEAEAAKEWSRATELSLVLKSAQDVSRYRLKVVEAKDEEIRQLRMEIAGGEAEELQGLRDAVEVGQVVAGSMGERSGALEGQREEAIALLRELYCVGDRESQEKVAAFLNPTPTEAK